MNGKWKGKILSLILVMTMVVQLFASIGTVVEASDTTKVTITGVGATSAKSINLVADITGPGGWAGYDNVTAMKYNGNAVTYPFGWVANNVLQVYMENDASLSVQSGDVIVLEKGTQFTVSGTIYELASGYRLTYNGSSWTGETIIETTKVTITGVGATSAKSINLVADITGPGGWAGYDNVTAMKYNGNAITYPFGWIANNVLQVYMENDASLSVQSGDVIVLEKGTQFTVSGTIYELASGYKLTYNGSSWTGETIIETTKVTITGVGATSAKSINLVADITGPGGWAGYDNATAMKYSGNAVTYPFGWVANNVLQVYMENDASLSVQSGDVIILEKGTQFTVSGTIYELTSGYKLTYSGSSWTGETISETPVETTKVAITGLGATNISAGNNTINLVTDIAGPGAIWTYDNNTAVKYNDANATYPLGWIGENVLQLIATCTFVEGDTIALEAGTQFTVEGVVYELTQTYTLYYYDGALTTEKKVEPTKVTITGLGATNISAGNNTINLVTDIAGPGAIWAYDNNTAVKYNNTDATYPLGWIGENVLQLIATCTFAEGDTIALEAGTQFTVAGVVYELTETYTLYYYDGALTTEKKVEPTKVTITALGATNISAGNNTINLVTDIAGPGAIWAYDNNTAVKYNNADATYPLGWIGENVLQLIATCTFAEGDSISLEKGTQFTVEGEVYELTDTYTLYYHNGALSTTMYYDVTTIINGNTETIEVTGDYVLPEISVDGYTALGWKLDDKLYRVGSTLPAKQEGYELEAVYAKFEQLKGAQVRLTAANQTEKIGGIRFVCKLGKDSKSEYITQMGILVMPTDYMTNGELTHDNYGSTNAQGTTPGYRQFVVNNADMIPEVYKADEAANGAEGYYLKGSIVNLYDYNYTRSYSARSFLTVAYADGTGYVYTDYSQENNARRICDIAKKMIESESATYAPVNNTQYPIVYEYAKVADTLTRFGFFGPDSKSKAEVANYAATGFDVLWLGDVPYRYHDRYVAQTVESENTYYNELDGFKLKESIQLAAEYGLDVVVYDMGIRTLSECDISLIQESGKDKQLLGLWLQTGVGKTAWVQGSAAVENDFDEESMTYEYEGTNFAGTGKAKVLNYLWQFKNESDLENYVMGLMSAYAEEKNFKGIMLADEPTESMFKQVALMTKIIKKLYPNAYVQSSNLPSYGFAENSGWSGYDDGYDTWSAEDGAWNKLLQMNTSATEMGINFYPYPRWYHSSKDYTYELREHYLATFQYLAVTTQKKGINLEFAVQSHATDKSYNTVSAERLYLQTNLALAFGADTLGYYRYDGLDEYDGDYQVTQTIKSDVKLQEAVLYSNKNGNYLKAHMTFFEYQKSKIFGSGTYVPTDSGDFTQSTLEKDIFEVSSGATVLINEFYNEISGEYGYYVVNLAELNDKDGNETSNAPATVTVKSDCWVYQNYLNYNDEKAMHENQEVTVTLEDGQGAFIVVK